MRKLHWVVCLHFRIPLEGEDFGFHCQEEEQFTKSAKSSNGCSDDEVNGDHWLAHGHAMFKRHIDDVERERDVDITVEDTKNVPPKKGKSEEYCSNVTI